MAAALLFLVGSKRLFKAPTSHDSTRRAASSQLPLPLPPDSVGLGSLGSGIGLGGDTCLPTHPYVPGAEVALCMVRGLLPAATKQGDSGH